MKKVLTLLFCTMMILGISTNVFAGEFNENEQYIINEITGKNFPVKIEQRYVNQLKNYLYQDDVDIVKLDAEDFVSYLKQAMLDRKEIEEKGQTFSRVSSEYQNFQKAGTAIGLLFEYDSSVNDFYAIDDRGYIVIDSQKVIKNTDSDEETDWNISIEVIFAIAVLVCILGLAVNFKRWNKKLKRKSSKAYEDDDEDDDELEIANRKTRKARLQTFSYKNTKQILKYFYVPILMGLIVVGVCFVIINQYSDLTDSINTNFVNTQPLYNDEDAAFEVTTVKADKQKASIAIEDVGIPKYGMQYGILECGKLKIDAPVYFGDNGKLLGKGAGTYIGSSLPGYGSTILVGAHDTTYFAGLEKVEKGDMFTFSTAYGIYEYKVSKIKIVDEDKYDEAYDLSSDKEQLVLYTCYPFGRLNGTKTERMFVYLDKVNGPNIQY